MEAPSWETSSPDLIVRRSAVSSLPSHRAIMSLPRYRAKPLIFFSREKFISSRGSSPAASMSSIFSDVRGGVELKEINGELAVPLNSILML